MGCETAFELGVLDGGKNFFEARAGSVAGGDEVVASEERLRTDGFGRQRGDLLAGEVVKVEMVVAGLAIEAMQFEVLVELGQADKALESGFFHFAHLAKAHVVRDQREDLRGITIREAQAVEDGPGHFFSNPDVIVKTNAVRRNAKGGRLADVVQQSSPGKSWRDGNR